MIYLDHAATSPLLDEVRDAMAPWWGVPANPSSAHAAGQRAAAAVERARAQVAALLERPPAGIVFTSGATEANHQALVGAARSGARTVALGALEHPSVHGAVAQAGLVPTALQTQVTGQVRVPEAPNADALCLMAANHETGVEQDLEAAARWAQAGSWWHCDATQALGKLPSSRLVAARSVAASAHKLGGPVGVGVLSLLDGRAFPALFEGGGQERGRRAGTPNVAGIVGFGAAAALALRDREARSARWSELRQVLERGMVALGGRIVGSGPRLETHCCVVFPDVVGEVVVQGLDLRGVAVSSGAACASGSLEPSPVLIAMGDPAPDGGVRVSLGPRSTLADVDALLHALGPVLEGAQQAL